VLENAEDAIGKYQELCLIFPEGENYPTEIVRGFRKYCSHYNKPNLVADTVAKVKFKKGMLLIVIEEIDLVYCVKAIQEKGLVLGVDVGLISFNETILKEILAGGIATISTHFEAMGTTAATLILEKQLIKIKNPFSLIRRPSL
jgi:DNA-binding LacI/PurR family transcriptional regulator